MAIYLFVGWIRLYVTFLLGFTTVDLYQPYGIWALAGGTVVAARVQLLLVASWSSAPRLGFRRLQPQFCSIYEPYFWWHERFWKLSTQPAVLQRHAVQGDRVADPRRADRQAAVRRRRLDDREDAGPHRRRLHAQRRRTTLQAHSMEDGVFKSDRIAIGSGVTLGAASFVHYGVTIGDDAVLAPDSFVMKGTEVPPRARWQGNPAREVAVAAQSRVRMRI